MPLKALRRKTLTNDPGYYAAQRNVQRALGTVRRHLDMDVAFISEFIGEQLVFKHVDSQQEDPPIAVGTSVPLVDTYCQKIVQGELPQLIPNTADEPLARTFAATHDFPIGSHLSVPLTLSDGHVYGTFCCFSFDARDNLTERDIAMMRAFADLVAFQIDTEISDIRTRIRIFDLIAEALATGQPSIVYQPVYSLENSALIGVEALARFPDEPQRSPDAWFADAAVAHLQVDLELQAMRNAITGFAPTWTTAPCHLGLNASPQTILDPRVLDILSGGVPHLIVIEITEHKHVDDYAALLAAMAPLRARGVKIAVDDAGSGYASMRHILNIRPDIIKLDVSLTQGIETDLTRLALARALCEFGRQVGCSLVAEGVETAAQLATLRDIGVHAAQGYYLARPMPYAQCGDLISNGGPALGRAS